jgi:hypothetical protein
MAKTAPRIRTLFGRDRLRRLRFALKRLEFPSSASKENDALPQEGRFRARFPANPGPVVRVHARRLGNLQT